MIYLRSMTKQEHPFSWQALMRIVVIGILVLLCWKALSVLPVIIIAFVLTTAFYPVIKKIQTKTKMPLILCIFLVLIIPIIPVFILAFLFIQRIVADAPALLTSLNSIVVHSTFIPSFLKDFNLSAYLQSNLDYTTATVNIAMVVFSVITTIILTFFLIYDFERLSELSLHFVSDKEKDKVKELFREIAKVTGKYIRGNLLISVICGIVLYAGLLVMHVPFALPLAIFAAVIDLLPLVGGTIGAIPAVIIGFGVSPLVGVLVIILHLLYQEIENAVLSPMIYNKALHLYPSVIFLSVLIGAGLFGILGAFLSLPIAASVPAIIEYRKNYQIRHGHL